MCSGRYSKLDTREVSERLLDYGVRAIRVVEVAHWAPGRKRPTRNRKEVDNLRPLAVDCLRHET